MLHKKFVTPSFTWDIYVRISKQRVSDIFNNKIKVKILENSCTQESTSVSKNLLYRDK